MVRRNVLFSLVPGNSAATEIVKFDSNRHLVQEGKQVLDLGHYISEATGNGARCIATIGRDGDIAVPPRWSNVSRIHYAFMVGATGHCITFVDMSGNASDQAYDSKGNSQEPRSSSPRQADSSTGLCKIEIRINGFNESKTAVFKILWRYPAAELASALQAWSRAELPRQPKLADTQVWPGREYCTGVRDESVPATDQQIRIGDLDEFKLATEPIARGAFGAVYKACNPSGLVVAVKIQKPRDRLQWQYLDRERKILLKLRHPNIVEHFGDKVDRPRCALFFMSLQNGSLEDLVEKRPRPIEVTNELLAHMAYHDILKGLDYLHSNGLIHRDLKPGNVLYTLKNNRPFFCLADFGITNSECSASTFCGTLEFMAPEVFYHEKQTVAVDMWSLLMTVLRTLDLANYRSRKFHDYPSFLKWVVFTISNHWDFLGGVHELAVIDSRKRATAAQMLVKNFQGDGLTTAKQKVPELRPVKAPNIRDLLKRTLRSEPTIVSAGNHRAPLQAIAPNRPATRKDLCGAKVVPLAQPLCVPAKPAFSAKVPQKRNLFINDNEGRGSKRKVVPVETVTYKHPAAREYSSPPQASLVGRRSRVPDGVRKRKTRKKEWRAGSNADVWFKEVYKIPGAFPA
ncbi:hypothetical protein V2A60_008664 [Cordyceps javanica]